MNKERLLELAGVEQLNEKRFDTAAKMLAHVFSELKMIRDVNNHPDAEIEDVMNDINDIIEQIEESEVRRS